MAFLPAFSQKNVKEWFTDIEAQLSIAKITDELTKYYHLLVTLDREELETVSDIVCDTLSDTPYSDLKKRLLQVFTVSETAQKNIEAILAMFKGTLEDPAVKANKVAERTVRVQNNEIKQSLAEVCSRLERLEHNTRSGTRNNYFTRNTNRSRSNTPVRGRSRSRNQEQHYDICWYHYTFKHQAKKCTKPCNFNRTHFPENNQSTNLQTFWRNRADITTQSSQPFNCVADSNTQSDTTMPAQHFSPVQQQADRQQRMPVQYVTQRSIPGQNSQQPQIQAQQVTQGQQQQPQQQPQLLPTSTVTQQSMQIPMQPQQGQSLLHNIINTSQPISTQDNVQIHIQDQAQPLQQQQQQQQHQLQYQQQPQQATDTQSGQFAAHQYTHQQSGDIKTNYSPNQSLSDTVTLQNDFSDNNTGFPPATANTQQTPGISYKSTTGKIYQGVQQQNLNQQISPAPGVNNQQSELVTEPVKKVLHSQKDATSLAEDLPKHFELEDCDINEESLDSNILSSTTFSPSNLRPSPSSSSLDNVHSPHHKPQVKQSISSVTVKSESNFTSKQYKIKAEPAVELEQLYDNPYTNEFKIYMDSIAIIKDCQTQGAKYIRELTLLQLQTHLDYLIKHRAKQKEEQVAEIYSKSTIPHPPAIVNTERVPEGQSHSYRTRAGRRVTTPQRY